MLNSSRKTTTHRSGISTLLFRLFLSRWHSVASLKTRNRNSEQAHFGSSYLGMQLSFQIFAGLMKHVKAAVPTTSYWSKQYLLNRHPHDHIRPQIKENWRSRPLSHT